MHNHLQHCNPLFARAVALAATVIVQQKVPVGSLWVDPGATASDNVDGDITARIATTIAKPVDTSRIGNAGEYWYDVTDSSGNAAERVVRKVRVAR